MPFWNGVFMAIVGPFALREGDALFEKARALVIWDRSPSAISLGMLMSEKDRFH